MTFDHTQSHPVFSKVIQYLLGVSHDKIERGCRMKLMEAKKNPRHKIPRQGCTGCQSDSSGDFPAQIQFAQNALELRKYMIQPLSETSPKRSQSHASGRTAEQGRFQIRFQPANVAGYRRLRKMKAAGGFRNLANLSDYEKRL